MAPPLLPWSNGGYIPLEAVKTGKSMAEMLPRCHPSELSISQLAKNCLFVLILHNLRWIGSRERSNERFTILDDFGDTIEIQKYI